MQVTIDPKETNRSHVLYLMRIMEWELTESEDANHESRFTCRFECPNCKFFTYESFRKGKEEIPTSIDYNLDDPSEPWFPIFRDIESASFLCFHDWKWNEELGYFTRLPVQEPPVREIEYEYHAKNSDQE